LRWDKPDDGTGGEVPGRAIGKVSVPKSHENGCLCEYVPSEMVSLGRPFTLASSQKYYEGQARYLPVLGSLAGLAGQHNVGLNRRCADQPDQRVSQEQGTTYQDNAVKPSTNTLTKCRRTPLTELFGKHRHCCAFCIRFQTFSIG